MQRPTTPSTPRTQVALALLLLLAAPVTADALPAHVNALFRRQSSSACFSLVNSACPGAGCIDATCSSTCTSAIPGLQACCDKSSFTQFVDCVQQLDDPDGSSTSSRLGPARTSSDPSKPFTPGVISSITDYTTDLPSRFTSMPPGAKPPAMSPTPVSMPGTTSIVAPAGSAGSGGPPAMSTAPAASADAAAAGLQMKGPSNYAMQFAALVLAVLL